ncbi:MAG: hypothetical protein KKA55_05700 [Proteobacteria bacterium]|nr:hypothetical protein [Pseudomonadota bacterium]MBU1595015.1 hypothetical protein [Pseudomonadota bacterium]
MADEIRTAPPMTETAPAHRDLVCRAGLVSAGAVVILASLGLSGGLIGLRLVDAARPELVPMAPSTAIVFLVLGGMVLLRSAAGPMVPGPRASSAVLLLLGAVVLLNLVGRLLGLDAGLLDLFFRQVSAWAGVSHTRMSPAAALLLLLSVAASWPLSWRRGGRPAPLPGLLRFAGLLGAAVALLGSVFLLGYVFGMPLLYHASVVPMARSTALAFLCLGAALVSEAGQELLPLRMFSGPATQANLLRAFVPLVVLLSLAHSLVLGLAGPRFGEGNALLVAGIAVTYAVSVGLMVLAVASRVGRSLELAEARRSEVEARVRAALREKTVLLKEIHHRVKNNMQLVSSLFSLQAEYVVDARDRTLFEESRERIQSMALVHEQLYASADLASVDMRDYVRRLAEQLTRGLVPAARLAYALEEVCLPVTQCVPFGMALNELLLNILKHAVVPARGLELRLALRVEGRENVLEVEDNGPGLPPGFSLEGPSTFGLVLLASLAQQLRGSLAAEDTGRGSRFTLRFAVERVECPDPGAP